MKNKLFIFSIIVLLLGCEKDDPRPETRQATLEAVTLVFPLKNSECNVGRDITDSTSTVRFEWRSALNADEYELVLTNLATDEVSNYTTAQDTIPIVLQRAMPYSWYVISRSSEADSAAQSSVWNFYNSGDGIQSYAPFPAEIITPKMSASITAPSGTITLDWEGNDVDDDIVGYDVYFGTTDPPSLFESDLSESDLNGVQVDPDVIYYWSVTTKDAFGHQSSTRVFQFVVE